MAEADPVGPPVACRRLPGTRVELPELGWALPRTVGSSAPLIRRAVGLGLSLLDVGPLGPAAPALSALDPEIRRRLTVLCSLGARGDPAAPALDPPEALATVQRLDLGVALLQVDEEQLLGAEARGPPGLADWDTQRSDRLWGVRVNPVAGDPSTLTRAADLGAKFFAVPASLLEGSGLGRVQRTVGERVGVVVTDPFAEGRLDGRMLRDGPFGHGPPAPPVPLEQLQEAYAPLLRLAYLTEGRRRTLAEAALLAVLRARGVCSVVVPSDDPGAVAQYAARRAQSELTPSELQQVARDWPVDLG